MPICNEFVNDLNKEERQFVSVDDFNSEDELSFAEPAETQLGARVVKDLARELVARIIKYTNVP